MCNAVDNVYHPFWDAGSLDIMHNVQFVKIYKVVHSGSVSKLYFNKNIFFKRLKVYAAIVLVNNQKSIFIDLRVRKVL